MMFQIKCPPPSSGSIPTTPVLLQELLDHEPDVEPEVEEADMPQDLKDFLELCNTKPEKEDKPATKQRKSVKRKAEKQKTKKKAEEDGESEYEVEKILAKKIVNGKEVYLLKWKGYPVSVNSWEPMEHLLGSKKMLREFNERVHGPDYEPEGKEANGSKSNSNKNDPPKKRFTDRSLVIRIPLPHRADIMKVPANHANVFHPLTLLAAPTSPFRNGSFKHLIKNPLYSPDSISFLSAEAIMCYDQTDDWLDIFGDGPRPYIEVFNDVDKSGPPEDFKYITQSFRGENVPEEDKNLLVGCQCGNQHGGCNAVHRGKCDCANGDSGHGILPYDGTGRLILPPRTAIIECNEQCTCNTSLCENRVIQRGTRCRFQIFRTSNGRGWGVRTIDWIPKGTFVEQYVGEIITNAEADRRGQTYDAQNRTYLFDLDYFYEDMLAKCEEKERLEKEEKERLEKEEKERLEKERLEKEAKEREVTECLEIEKCQEDSVTEMLLDSIGDLEAVLDNHYKNEVVDKAETYAMDGTNVKQDDGSATNKPEVIAIDLEAKTDIKSFEDHCKLDEEDEPEAEIYTMDATKHGNITHFFNHSCDPNLVVHPFFGNCADPRFHGIAFFACKDIMIGEELCFDYTGGIHGQNFALEEGYTLLACLCNSEKCRGVIKM